MDARLYILNETNNRCRERLRGVTYDDEWENAVLVRACALRFQRGEQVAWNQFINRLARNLELASLVQKFLEEAGIVQLNLVTWLLEMRGFPAGITPLDADDTAKLLSIIDFGLPDDDRLRRYTEPKHPGKSEIMYIEAKTGISGPARIGRVTFSKTRRTIYYRGRKFQSLNGRGYKTNYFDTETNRTYWISGCKKDGTDRLYSGTVEIDDDVREEYWRSIRRMPQYVGRKSFRVKGKY